MTIEVFGVVVATEPLDESKVPGRGSSTKTTHNGSDPDDND